MEVSHKKESLLLTSGLFLLLFLVLYFLTYSSQAIMTELEGGGGGGDIAVNFGNSEVGSGNNFESMEIVKQAKASRSVQKVEEEEMLTNASDNDVPTMASTPKVKKEKPKKEIIKPVEEVKPKPSKSTNDALSSLLGGSSSKGGDGNDGVVGNKGKIYGNPNASGYNGGGGNGSGQGMGTGSGYGTGYGSGKGSGVGNYQLSGRNVVAKARPKYTCNEEGTVVVEITVNNNGVVTDATAGIKGTTNTARCLLDQARQAAMNTKFDSNSSAPDRQMGKIIYNFKLTE